MTASPFDSYVAPARAKPQLWRLAAGIVLAAMVYVALIGALMGGIRLVSGPAAARRWMEDMATAATPGGTLLLMASFLAMAAGAAVAARLLHGRAVATLFGPRARVIRHFIVAAGLVGAVYGASILAWLLLFEPEPNLSPARWLRFLPFALLGLVIQTGAEELLFRGYLQQQLAARFRSPLIWMVLPAAVFGAVHYDPSTAGENAPLLVVAAAAFGLVGADLTARTGSLGAAWGVHFANNVFAVLIVAVEDTLAGLALYTTPYTVDDTGVLRLLILGDLVVLALAWALVRRVLRP